MLLTLSILAGAGVLNYHDNTKLILIAGLAVTFGSQNCDRPSVRHPGAIHHGPDVDDRRGWASTADWQAAPDTAKSCATAWS